MTYDEDVTREERKKARNLAIGIHVVLIVLLIFGVSWHRRSAEPSAVADLWSTMSPPRQEAPPKVEKEPPLKMTPRIEKEPPPPPPPKPEVKRDPKPDIALKEKLEKEKKLKEDERKREEEKKLKLAEAKKKDEDKRRLEQQELERRKLEDEKRLAERQAAEKDAAAKAAASAAQSRAFNEYITRIQSKVRSNIIEPPNLPGNPEVEFEVVILPGGEIMDGGVRLRRSSGVPAYDQAVERAILKSSPLPVPPAGDPLFNEFRRPTLVIRPK